MPTSSAPRPTPTLTLLVAGDPNWLSAGSTRWSARDVSERRVAPPVPLNMDVLALTENYEADMAAAIARHGGPASPGSKRNRDTYAAALAEGSPAAAAEFEEVRLVAELRTACTIGEGLDVIGAISCPGCQCWSLLPVRDPSDGWRAACRNLMCGTPEGPRTWPLQQLAAHHLRETRAA